MPKIFKSYNQYLQHYFPKYVEEEKIRNMSPEKYGKYLAQKSINKILKGK